MSEVFAIPCPYRNYEAGQFFMKYDYDGNDESHHYFMADTEKLIAKIAQDDPEMIDHAQRKYEGDMPEDWLKYNSKDNPCAIGVFVFDEYVNVEGRTGLRQQIKNLAQNRHGYQTSNGLPYALTFSEGWAGTLILIQNLKLPFVPIAVYRSRDADYELRIAYLKRLIGIEAVH